MLEILQCLKSILQANQKCLIFSSTQCQFFACYRTRCFFGRLLVYIEYWTSFKARPSTVCSFHLMLTIWFFHQFLSFSLNFSLLLFLTVHDIFCWICSSFVQYRSCRPTYFLGHNRKVLHTSSTIVSLMNILIVIGSLFIKAIVFCFMWNLHFIFYIYILEHLFHTLYLNFGISRQLILRRLCT